MIGFRKFYDLGLLPKAYEWAEEKHRTAEYFAVVFAMYHYVAFLFSGGKPVRVPVIWNSLMRKVGGIGLVEDRDGDSVIHESEPMQAMFLTTRAFEVISRVPNTGYERNHSGA